MKKFAALLILVPALAVAGCDDVNPVSASGVKEAAVKIAVGSDGLTAEQRNIVGRLKEDNKPGSIKHLYIISAYSGQVIIYSTVRGKVTSGGKRLTPTSIVVGSNENNSRPGFSTNFGGAVTSEVIQDDGTYGTSGDYLYWWDTKGVYHQHYVSGGQILHISSQPLVVKEIIINMELIKEGEPSAAEHRPEAEKPSSGEEKK